MKSVEVERRRQRAKDERFQVERLGDDPIYAAFRIVSLGSENTYTVHIRDLSAPGANGCTCPDFLVNQLGTCKHLEAVVNHLQEHERIAFRRARLTPPPHAHIYLTYGEQLALEARRPLQPSHRIARLIDAHFDFQGRFRGDPISHFREFEEDLARLPPAERSQIHLASEVLPYIEHQRELRRRSAERGRFVAALEAGRERFDPLREPLYDYQIRGAVFLAFNERAMLADEIGLGKTVQALAAASWLRQRRGMRRCLIICPAALKLQWAREVERFTGEAAAILEGADREDLYRNPRSDTLVASYEVALRDRDALRALAPDIVILDEAQRIKNWRTRTAQAVKEIPRKAAFVLTGAPIESDLEALYSIAQFLDQRLIGPLWRFTEQFYRLDGRGRQIGYRNLDELKARLAPIYLRRAREDVSAELPEVLESYVPVQLGEQARAAYEAARQRALVLLELAACAPLDAEQRRELDGLFAAMLRACANPSEGSALSPKLEEARAIIEETVLAGGRKALIFAESRDLTSAASKVLDELDIAHIHFHGAIPHDERAQRIQDFVADERCRVLVSTDLGSVGLNLQVADVIINLDQPLSASRRNQRLGRVFRIGRREPVQLIHVLAAETFEENIPVLKVQDRSLLSRYSEADPSRGPVELSFEIKNRNLRESLAELLLSAPEPRPRRPRRPKVEATLAPAEPRFESLSPPSSSPGALFDALSSGLAEPTARATQAMSAPLSGLELEHRPASEDLATARPRAQANRAELEAEAINELSATLRRRFGGDFLGLARQSDLSIYVCLRQAQRHRPNFEDLCRSAPPGLELRLVAPADHEDEPDEQEAGLGAEAARWQELRVELGVARALLASGFIIEALARAERALARGLGEAELAPALARALQDAALPAAAARELSLIAVLARQPAFSPSAELTAELLSFAERFLEGLAPDSLQRGPAPDP